MENKVEIDIVILSEGKDKDFEEVPQEKEVLVRVERKENLPLMSKMFL